VPERVLAVYAHPDDADVSCGGTMARWASEGASVCVVVCASGDKGSSDPSVDPGDLAARRAGEVDRAMAALRVGSHQLLGHPDGDLVNGPELRGELVALVREVRPDVVLCPDPTSVFFGDGYVNHRDHRVTGWATLDAISPASGNPHYFRELRAEGLDVHQPRAVYLSGTFEPNVWIDIADTLDRKIEALFCHASQLEDTSDWFRDFLRDTAEAAGRTAGITYAEGFRRIQLG